MNNVNPPLLNADPTKKISRISATFLPRKEILAEIQEKKLQILRQKTQVKASIRPCDTIGSDQSESNREVVNSSVNSSFANP